MYIGCTLYIYIGWMPRKEGKESAARRYEGPYGTDYTPGNTHDRLDNVKARAGLLPRQSSLRSIGALTEPWRARIALTQKQVKQKSHF